MKKKICFQTSDGAFPITLYQTGRDRFTVVYGLQGKRDLDYSAAAHELGACIMHSAACEGKLDNRESGER